MNQKIEKVRGTADWYELDALKLLRIKNKLFNLGQRYGYKYIVTPLIENRSLFVRSVGDTSDIVKKEFYEFTDKGGREIALRPEGTASVIRCVSENKLSYKYHLPLKYFYFGSMYRYERPQSGRNREFYQFGVECIGSHSYYDDAEILLFATEILNELGIKDWVLSINNIGSLKSRSQWIKELQTYFSKYKDQFTQDSLDRLDTNPLRILDDKVDGIKPFVKKAPKIDQYLSKEEVTYFNNLKHVLDEFKIKYVVDPSLVRGLDYYTNFVFEINTSSPILKGQPTLVAGGRYGNLLKELGGQDLSCVGFACGIERLMLMDQAKVVSQHLDLLIATVNEDCCLAALKLMQELRQQGYAVLVDFNDSKLANQFNVAKNYQVDTIGIIGPKELANQSIILKNQQDQSQKTMKITELLKEGLKHE